VGDNVSNNTLYFVLYGFHKYMYKMYKISEKYVKLFVYIARLK